MGFGMEEHGGSYLYLNPINPDLKYSDLHFYDDIRLLAWLEPETGEKTPFIRFPETSICRNGKYFFRDSWSPVFTLDDKNPYVIYGSEPIIYIYEAFPPYSLISSLPLDLPDYQYFKGYEKKDRDESFSNKSTSETRVFLKRMHEKYPIRIAILDSLGNMLNDFVLKDWWPNSMLGRDGELWMQEKPNEEEEEDYFRLFRVGLKIE